MANHMDMVNQYGQMETIMRVSFETERDMDKERGLTPMVQNIREIMLMTNHKEKVNHEAY